MRQPIAYTTRNAERPEMPQIEMLAAKLASPEWGALIACAKPIPAAEEVTGLLRDADCEKLLALAEDHGVMPLLAAALLSFPHDAIPETIRAELSAHQRAHHFFTLRMSAELFRLSDLFAAQNIGVLPVKGPALAMQAYGEAAMRNYGDLDLLVRHADVARATKLMTDAGYEAHVPLTAIAAGKIPGQYMFRQREAKLLVELHNDRTMRYYPRPLPIEELFARRVQVAMDGRGVPAPCIEDHLVLICIHGAKHFWERLQWIADVAALVSRQPNINWEQASRSAREVGAETMLHAGLLLAVTVFQTALPAAVRARAEADGSARKLTEQALRWLPAAGYAPPSLRQRALFRMRMRGGSVSGANYLLRMLVSPTEEDWNSDGTAAHGLLNVLRRPFRLAKKYSSKP
jgi:hypothetical protein